eukprot:CAMPEP_0176064982 /NCGR_PEP_ID=MMETSP0120_2-20121206/32416_1 /TAXON_ID=160619 /ORGANISM="Kryptoperidinium foliaceum, Strain CCMP 1326" /LENGTH=157 /DNA_ID=CAMNT_0017398565 /DNA_START=59 /DNA_END=532 /DNA_ORIENTATION=+
MQLKSSSKSLETKPLALRKRDFGNKKRSKASYSPTNSSVHFRIVSSSTEGFGSRGLRRKSPLRFSQANASWSHPTDFCNDSLVASPLKPKRKPLNMFLEKDQELHSLLRLLRTEEFLGEIHPDHHSRYLEEPSIEIEPQRPRLLGEKKHRSEGQLLL